MATQWTTDQVTAMAPDAASVKAGRKLGSTNTWMSLGQSSEVLWGECKGSGKTPYQTCIELSGPAFKCSCPSRKFPCKHALGLAFVFAEQTSALPLMEIPSWVSEWLAKRSQRATAAKVAKAAKAAQPVDDATHQRRIKAQQKRAAMRDEKVRAGVEELQRWLQDVVRQGLGQLMDQPDPWSKMAAHMIDAQAPGLARSLQRIGDLRYQLTQWQEPMLEQMAKLHLLLSAFQRKENLTPSQQADIDALIGYTQNKEDVLTQDGIRDTWWVLSQRSELDPQLQVQRTWLWGQHSKRYALLMDFAALNQTLPMPRCVGQGLQGELVFYPGSWPVRALLKTEMKNLPTDVALWRESCTAITSGLQHYTSVLTRYPWLAGFPLGLSQVTPVRSGEEWLVVDTAQRLLPMAVSAQTGWALLAASGGQAVNIFGEWDGRSFLPLSVDADGALHNLMGSDVELAG